MTQIVWETLAGAAIGFAGVWWTHFAFASRAIKDAGLRLARTLDGMFFTVPFFAIANPLWLHARLPGSLQQAGVPSVLADLATAVVGMATPVLCYRLAAFIPGVLSNRRAIAECSPGWSGNPQLMSAITGIPRGAFR